MIECRYDFIAEEPFMKDRSLKKYNKYHPFILMTVFCAVMFSITSLILSPIYVLVSSDITLYVTVLPTVIEIVLELCETLTFALCYSLVIFTASVKKFSNAAGVCGIYVAASVIRRSFDLAISALTYGSIDSTDITNVIVYVTLETAQIAIILAASMIFSTKYKRKKKATQQLSVRNDDLCNTDGLDFNKVYDRENPMMSSALVGGIMLSALKIGMRINYDRKYIKVFGTPSGISEILTMVVYYMSDILVSAIFYALCWLILSKLLKRFGNDTSTQDNSRE